MLNKKQIHELKVEPVIKEDEPWIKTLFEDNKDVLGSFSMAWFRYWNYKKPHNHWVKLGEFAFVNYINKLKGGMTIYQVAVSRNCQRLGIAKRILDEIGYPEVVVTDSDSVSSNNFYKKMGYTLVGKKKTRNGKKLINVYQIWR